MYRRRDSEPTGGDREDVLAFLHVHARGVERGTILVGHVPAEDVLDPVGISLTAELRAE
jgi:hypothetical protein